MEDFYETNISEVDGQMVAFFDVFDGHGGSRTAEYLKNNLSKNLSSHPDFIKDTKSAIVESFRRTDANYLDEEKSQQKDAGSTASTSVLVGDRLLVANVGDSSVVASRLAQEGKTFDESFLRKDTSSLVELVNVANYLQLRPLYEKTCQAIARRIEDESPEEIRHLFNFPDDLTEAEKLEPWKNAPDDSYIRLLNRLYAKRRKNLKR